MVDASLLFYIDIITDPGDSGGPDGILCFDWK